MDMEKAYEQVFWILFGLGISSLVGHSIWVHIKMLKHSSKINDVRSGVKDVIIGTRELVSMHKHPDDHGFGTKATNGFLEKMIQRNENLGQSIVELTIEIRMLREQLKKNNGGR